MVAGIDRMRGVTHDSATIGKIMLNGNPAGAAARH